MLQMGDSGLGVPARRPAYRTGRLAVALSAASPRADYRTVGFPLQSLTRATLCFAVVCMALGASAQFFHPYDYMNRELLHEQKVKCMSIYTVSDTSRVRSEELCFNGDGRLVEHLSFWGVPVRTDSALLIYDDKGNEIEYVNMVWVTESFTPEGEPIRKRVRAHYRSIYDRGRLVRSETDSDGYYMGGRHYSTLEYDSLNHVVEQIDYDTVKSASKRTTIIKDNEDRELLCLWYEDSGRLTAYEATSYDDRGRKSSNQLVNTGKDSAYRSEYRFYYDASSKLIKEERFSGGNIVPVVVEYRYSPDGLLVEIISPNQHEAIEYTFYP